jgi:transposase
VTLQLLWQEYKQAHPDDGYQYTQFCEYYRRFRRQLDVVLRQDHRAGEKMFVDFSGDGIPITDPETGEVREAPLFVAVLGASSYTFAEALSSEGLRDWITGHVHAYEYFGGVPALTVPDNPKTAVLRPCRYEPAIHPTYAEMARHYSTAILPARPRKPRDKAKVESAVLLAQRWILAPLRNQTFFSPEESNEAIVERLDILNNHRFQKLDTTRAKLFEQLDKPALRPLPPTRYQFADWSTRRVNIDYHVEIEGHYYSAPHELIHKQLEARITTTTMELFFRNRRVASHPRSFRKGSHTTDPAHMPKAHRKYLEWTPSRILAWAAKTGPQTEKLAEAILSSRPHPEQGYRSCLGLLRLGKAYGKGRLENACGRALTAGACSYKSVASILKTGLDQQPLLVTTSPRNTAPKVHPNLRGTAYFQQPKGEIADVK